MTTAQAAITNFEKAQAPKLAEEQRKRAEVTAKLEAELKSYESTGFAKKMADWEKGNAASVINRWQVLEPKPISATNGSQLSKEADGSIVVSGSNKNGVVTISAETDLTGITGVRLEVLTDARLPNTGPGRASDGNFVLNELELIAAPKGTPKQAKAVKLTNALADFSQTGLEVAKAIDGSPNDPASGWAVAPATGVIHWATFQTSEPIGTAGGTLLTFKMHHKYGEVWTLGRFRLSVTRGTKPVGLGLPEDFRAILATAADMRTPAQTNLLIAYFHAVDTDYRAKVDKLNASRTPVPIDSKLKELRDQLVFAQRPVQPGPAWSSYGIIWR